MTRLFNHWLCINLYFSIKVRIVSIVTIDSLTSSMYYVISVNVIYNITSSWVLLFGILRHHCLRHFFVTGWATSVAWSTDWRFYRRIEQKWWKIFVACSHSVYIRSYWNTLWTRHWIHGGDCKEGQFVIFSVQHFLFDEIFALKLVTNKKIEGYLFANVNLNPLAVWHI